MKKDLLPIFFLLLPLINFGQTVQPIEKIVVTKINYTFKDSLIIPSPSPKYVIPIHIVKPIETISIKKELEEYLKRNYIGLNENYFKNRIIKSESDSLKFKSKTSPEFKIGLSEFKLATMSIRNKNYIGIGLSENYLKNETKSELDSLKCNDEINHSKIRKKHNIGIGYGFAFAFALSYVDQPHHFFGDNYAVIAYKYLISLKATDFIALKTTHSFNIFNVSSYKKSSYRWTVELGYEYKKKKLNCLMKNLICII